MSTVGPESVTAAANTLQAAGARVIDAPVTGGVARDRTGELVIFDVGAGADIDHVTPARTGANARVAPPCGDVRLPHHRGLLSPARGARP
jgi:3-hydroxyisobutyrate dehydrogenase-like beta-hydroxyacid dehydrogenase